MNTDVAIAIIGMVLTLAGGASIVSLLAPLLRHYFGHPVAEKSYSERLSSLTSSLTNASSEVDALLRDLALVARDREASVSKLEGELAALERREKELKDKIETLQMTPLPVAEHFAKLLQSGERRSARRDYLLFGMGVVTTTVITIVIQVLSR